MENKNFIQKLQLFLNVNVKTAWVGPYFLLLFMLKTFAEVPFVPVFHVVVPSDGANGVEVTVKYYPRLFGLGVSVVKFCVKIVALSSNV